MCFSLDCGRSISILPVYLDPKKVIDGYIVIQALATTLFLLPSDFISSGYEIPSVMTMSYIANAQKAWQRTKPGTIIAVDTCAVLAIALGDPTPFG